MMTKVAIIAPGAMGGAVGRRLSEHGARVLTSLTGRSTPTIGPAEAAGMIGVIGRSSVSRSLTRGESPKGAIAAKAIVRCAGVQSFFEGEIAASGFLESAKATQTCPVAQGLRCLCHLLHCTCSNGLRGWSTSTS
jgi:hypothetical protein